LKRILERLTFGRSIYPTMNTFLSKSTKAKAALHAGVVSSVVGIGLK